MTKPTEWQRRAGKRMEQAAVARGWNAYDVAAHLGIRPPTVYRWYRGSRPNQVLLERFAELVGRPVSEFYADEQEPPEAALRLLLAWAERLMAGDSAVQAIRYAGMAVEDLSALEVSGLIASEEQLRADLTRASRGAWSALTLEQRADILRALAQQRASGATEDDPPPVDARPHDEPDEA